MSHVSSSPLRLRGVVKRFGGTLAVDSVDLDVQRGSILALLGPNGAGKSTLIKLLAGVHRPDAGEVILDGRQLDWSPRGRPIAFIHQELGLIEGMTTAENIAIGRGYPRRLGLIDWSRTAGAARDALSLLSLDDIDVRALAEALSPAERALVAVARAFTGSARFIVLDEPTASLPEADVARVFAAMRRLKDHGAGILLVTHRLDEVFQIADRVAVMRDGRLSGVHEIGAVSRAELVERIAGRAVRRPGGAPGPRGPVVLSLREARTPGIRPLSFDVRASEVLGLAGLRGAGQEVVGRMLVGAAPLSGGEVLLDGRSVAVRSPRDALRLGISIATSNRHGDSLAMRLTAGENLFLNPAAQRRRSFELMSPGEERRRARALMRRFDVTPAEPERGVSALSGGNQQKLVVARGLSTGGRLLVLEEPTLGVDVGARDEIHALLQGELRRGLAAVLISSDFDEIASVCSRALVFRRGAVVAELRGGELSTAALVDLAAGGAGEAVAGAGRGGEGPSEAPGAPPGAPPRRGVKGRWAAAAARLLGAYGLLLLTVALALLFSLLLPDTFPTAQNARAIASDRSLTALAALAAMLPMAAGKFDLSLGHGIGLSHVLAVALQVHFGVPWPLAAAIVALGGGLVGLINGLLVELAAVDSFVATLGTGTVLYALSNWYTGGRQVVGALPRGFVDAGAGMIGGVPVVAGYALGVAVVSFVALEYLPFGRYLHAIGANPRAARLVGIPVRRCVIGAFVGSGALAALIGVALAARLQIAQSSIGLEYLLPAFVGALLGSTTFRPGRVNVPGTLVAVLLLAVGVSGLQQLGTSYFVEPLFNGLTLIAAVVLAAYGQRRRSGADAHERADSRLDDTESSPAGPGVGAGERWQGEEGTR